MMIDAAYWASCQEGNHLILGWKTICYDVNLGEPFGANMVDDGDNDTALKIKQAWFQATHDTNQEDLVAKVVGEEKEMGDDYAWGEGPVADDPTPDGDHYWWEHTHGDKQTSERNISSERLNDPGLDRIKVHSSRGYTVIYDSRLRSQLSLNMYRFPVIPVVVNEDYVQGIADAILASLGRMGDAVGIGEDRIGNFTMSDYPDYLFVSQATGAATLIDTELWLSEPGTNLPDPIQAESDATQLLIDLGRYPADVEGAQIRWFTGAAAEDITGVVLGDTSDYNIQVGFRRSLMGYPVTGPGAKISVDLGSNGYVERWSEAGWRSVGTPEMMALIPLDDILTVLATHGSDATIDGITLPADTILINEVIQGYYEYNRWTDQEYIEPIYIISATLLHEGAADDFTIHMDALRVPPTVSISTPSDSSLFEENTPINFQAIAMGGTPPYSFEWTSNIDGPLGSGSSIQTTLSVGYKGADLVMHSITVAVTDNAGVVAHKLIRVGTYPIPPRYRVPIQYR
jgi:hypothetical protein